MIRPVVLLLGCWLLLVAAAAPDNPFIGQRRPTGGSEPQATAAAPSPLHAVVAWTARTQMTLNAHISTELRRLWETRSLWSALTVAAISFLYGVLHAAGPGHGKFVVSSYFLAREARPLQGAIVGGAVSLLQVASSLVIVSLLGIALDRSGLDVMAKGTWLEAMSYGLVVVIGLGMTVSALLGHTHTHRPLFGAVERGTGPGLVLAAGLTPCASATILLLFALANGLFVLGMVAALVMAVGMGVTVTLVGLVAILGRRALLVPTRHRPRAGAWLRRALTVTGAMALTLIGSLLFAGAWTRLP